MEQIWYKIENKVLDYLSKIDLLDLASKIFYAAIIVLIAYVLLSLRTKIIQRAFKFSKLQENKKRTLITMLMSVTKYTIFVITILLILAVFLGSERIAPLLAGAGIIGLAIGFGAQSLVKDIITGFFIMFEDQYHVGDFVQINEGVTGTVEELGLRMTTIREWSGKKFYIPNSEIKTVRNYNREELRAAVSVTFPFEENPVRIRQVLQEVCDQITREHAQHLLPGPDGGFAEPPQILGVTDIDQNDKGGRFTIIAKTKPESLWAVERIMRELIWQKCNEHGIRIAYPRRILESGKPIPKEAPDLAQDDCSR